VSRLLFLLPSVPDPADSGARLRNLMLLRLAAEAHTVDAIAFGQPEQRASLARLAERTQIVAPLPRRTMWQRSGEMARSRLPDMAERLWSAELAEAVRCLAPEADLLQAEGIEMARYLSLAPAQKRVYDAHNPEFLLQRRLSEAAPSIPARLYSRMQWQRLERFERAVVRTSSLTLAVSQHDANQLRALADGACVSVVPNGVDAHAYPLREALVGHDLLFLGKLDYRPNADAVRWLLRAVLPGIFESAPQARLFVVGANPPRWLVEAGQRDARIAVTGYVVDERPYLRRCCALLLPIRIAAGARLKALVAMASGVPIVSTALGMEGLAAVPGTDYIRAESAGEWVRSLQRLLGDKDTRQSVARSARAVVEQRYDWPAVRPSLRAAYATIRQ
jgi:polysaccharide biosynthesis protein PslH